MIQTLAETDLIILAGGLGTRLQPVLEAGQPKAMADISARPFIDYQIRWLYRQGIRRITLALGYGSDIIQQYIEQTRWPDDLILGFVVEKKTLGTGGAIRFALDATQSDHVFACNGDTIAILDLKGMLERHLELPQSITMALAEVDDCSRFGSVQLNPDGSVKSFIEKSSSKGHGLVNAGVYIMQRNLVSRLPLNEPLSWEQECLPTYCSSHLHGLINCERFLDMGTPESLSSSPAFLETL